MDQLLVARGLLRASALAQWQAGVKQRRLFSDDDWTTDWLRSLGAALPEWCCFVSARLPWWFGSSAPACDIATAAGVILQEAHLGGFIERFQMVGALVPHIGSHKIDVLAIRFLMPSGTVVSAQ